MRKPSETAQLVAFARAWETYAPDETRMCYDPIAEHLIPEEGQLIVTTEQGREHFKKEMANPAWEAVQEYVALRTRVIDSYLHDYAQKGLSQLLILGAGFDSRAYRFPELKGNVKIFEVDNPETQEVKKAKLSKYFGSLPDYVKFASMDFENDNLAATLIQAGFDPSLKTLVIWEGVTYYLESMAVDQILDFVTANTPAGSSIIFDHIPKAVVEGKSQNPLVQAFLQNIAERGEPYKFGLDPQTVEQFLTQRGFDEVINLTVEQCKKKFLTPAHGERNPMAEFSIVRARVA